MALPPVITIDGPSASGKGSVASRLAERLGFHYLDSGALYRLLALDTQRKNIASNNEAQIALAAVSLAVSFENQQAYLQGECVEEDIRTETIGQRASEIAALPAVRAALVQRQRAFRQAPGLVCDGRDMGSVIFPDASLKIFLTASAQCRAERRYKQLKAKGLSDNLNALLQEIETRDQRDAARAVAPLRQEADTLLLDTTDMTIDQAVNQALQWWHHRQA